MGANIRAFLVWTNKVQARGGERMAPDEIAVLSMVVVFCIASFVIIKATSTKKDDGQKNKKNQKWHNYKKRLSPLFYRKIWNTNWSNNTKPPNVNK